MSKHDRGQRRRKDRSRHRRKPAVEVNICFKCSRIEVDEVRPNAPCPHCKEPMGLGMRRLDNHDKKLFGRP